MMGSAIPSPFPSNARPPFHRRSSPGGTHALRTLQPLDQNSQFALVQGITTGTNVTLQRNGSTLVSQTVDDVDLNFVPSPPPSPSPGNLTDGMRIVMQGTFTSGAQSEILAYDIGTQDWWMAVWGNGQWTWTLVQTTPSLGNINDGLHTWWVGDLEGSGRQQVLIYGFADDSWHLGVVAGDAGSVAFGSMTWTTFADTGDTAWANPASTTSWVGSFSGGGQQQILTYDTSDSNWFLGTLSSTATTITWTNLGSHDVGDRLVSPSTTLTGDFSGGGETELLVFDGASTWTLVRMSQGALTVARVSDWTCGDCTAYAGTFSGSKRSELLASNRWGRIASPTDLTLTWTDLASGAVPSTSGTLAHVGYYTAPTRSELLVYYPPTAPSYGGDWVRFALDASSLNLTRYTDANTRGLPPLVGDPERMVLVGAFGGGQLDDIAAFDSVSGAGWMGTFGQGAIALPSLLSPGDVILASSAGGISNEVVVANDVSTEHYDNARSGSNSEEAILTPAAVLGANSTFSVKATYNVSQIDPSTGLESGRVDAQPLVIHDVPFDPPMDAVYVATEADWVYAFPAAGTGTPDPLAARQLVLPGEAPLPWPDQNLWCKNIYPTVGVASTPVVDTASRTLYVVARTRDASGHHHTRLHALDLVTLDDLPSSPVELKDPSGIGQEPFALLENQRAALLLDQGRVWVTFGGHCDTPPYAGYAFIFDARTLDLLNTLETVSDPSSTVSGAGIWQGGVGPASSFLGPGNGRVFMSTGNLVGTGDGGEYASDAVLGVTYPYAAMGSVWTPVNESALSAIDWDLSSSGVVVLPNSAVLVGGKQGYLYVIDQGSMQCVSPGYNPPDGCATLNPPYSSLDPCGLPLSVDPSGCPILATPSLSYPTPGLLGAPAVYTDASGATSIFIKGGNSSAANAGWLKRFTYESTTRKLSLSATAATNYATQASVSVSGNEATATGLVWFIDRSAAEPRLVVYAMADLSVPEQTFGYGPQPASVSGPPFTEPTVMDGRVYIGFSGGVSVLAL
jgi:hypothetical protein